MRNTNEHFLCQFKVEGFETVTSPQSASETTIFTFCRKKTASQRVAILAGDCLVDYRRPRDRHWVACRQEKKVKWIKRERWQGGENVTRELLWKQETGNKGPFPLLPLSFVTCRGKKRKRFCLFPRLVAVLNMRRPHKPLADHMLITGVMGITFQRPREKILVTQTGGPHLALLFEKNGDHCVWLGSDLH